MNARVVLSIPLFLAAVSLGAQDGARTVTPLFPARRLALVIGNQAYLRKPLRNPRADADAMEALLRGELGFSEVHKIIDGHLTDIQRAIREFVRQLRPGDLALFYYAGHGMQVDGVNWMIPVDFHADFEDDVPDQAYSAQRVLKDLEDAGTAVRILILDACRDNPLPAARRSVRDGLARMSGAEGTYILFSTGDNQTADDNSQGKNSLFTGFLLEALRHSGVTLDAAFKETRRAVYEASKNTPHPQRPWLLTDIDSDLILRPAAPQGTATAQPSATPAVKPPAPPTISPTANAAPRPEAVAEAWAVVRATTDPALVEAFLAEYGDTDYAGAARLRLALLRPSGSSPSPGTVAPPKAAVSATAPGMPTAKVNPRDGLIYVWIRPGRFIIGCSPGDAECFDDEKPAHQVSITKGFWMGQTPVTQQAYERIKRNNPSHFKGASLPVETVSWDEAQAYCKAVGGRLPTEAEWEYAARAGTTGPRYYGELDQIAWHSGNSGGKTHEVGQKDPNAFDLYDMLGNVWQWIADWYDSYRAGAQTDPSGPPNGQARAPRGGSWYGDPRFVRVSDRAWRRTRIPYSAIGFRCVGEYF